MLKSFLKKFAPDTYQSIFDSGVNSGRIKESNDIREQKEKR